MGSFVFKWDHPAEEVYVTGTFDDWAKSVRLEKKGTSFEKRVDIPAAAKTYYKFVVDGIWTTDHTAPQETDEHSNVNNVLTSEDLTMKPPPTAGAFVSGVTPQSTTAQLAGQVPKEARRVSKPESDGSPPETPWHDAQEFKVDPIPATAGIGNPISLKPGEKVPAPSTITQNTVTSNVTTDKESYEKGPSAPPQDSTSGTSMGAFGVPPVTGNIIPESGLPMGGSSGQDAGPTIQSTGVGATTATLAAQVPKEPRGVPTVVSDSQKAVGADPEASGNAEAVREKSAVEKELESKVPEEPATSTNTGIPIAPTVPDTVQESIAQSSQSPEAAANKTAVEEKKQVESELLQKTEPAQESGEPAPSDSAALSATAPSPTAAATTTPAAANPATTEPATTTPAPTTPATTSAVTPAAAPPAPVTPAKKVSEPHDDSRDVSPMSKPAGTAGNTAAAVTTGVGSSSTPTKSTPTGNSSAGTDKKSKRSSGFFHKIKAKFSDKDKKST